MFSGSILALSLPKSNPKSPQWSPLTILTPIPLGPVFCWAFKMAESEDEIDVEDISDGEHISNLRNVVEDDQKESWFVDDYSIAFTFFFVLRHLQS